MKFDDWKIPYDIPDVPQQMLSAGLTPLLAQILLSRGISTVEEATEKLRSDSSLILNPLDITGMKEAVERIETAIQNGEKIAVYGDYDVDGITSTCLLTEYLRSRGVAVTPYIPDRAEEGYGLNCNALQTFAQEGITLVITVDCGITATEEAAFAANLGIDMIITDHHECKEEEIPHAVAVIDCKQPSDTYAYKNLAGVGTAFKLVCALDGSYEKVLEDYCDFIAIGTVADVMILDGENRCYVTKGLQKLRTSPRPGVKALLDKANVNYETVSAASISFTLSPRINAAGRLNQASLALDLLMSKTEQEAEALAEELCELNRKRQDIETYIWQQASAEVGKLDTSSPIVLSSSEWHQGVIGIAASRLAEQYNVPTIMIYLNKGRGKGSCRSYGGFNLFEALKACSDSLESFGGHALAAGLNIREENIPEFKKLLSEYYKEHKPENVPKVQCDFLITDPALLSVENVRSIDLLEPFGNGNAKPVLCILDATLEEAVSIGNGKHSKLLISYKGVKFHCVFFSHAISRLGVSKGDAVDLAFTPQINEYYGVSSVQLVLCAIRKHRPDELLENILDSDNVPGKAVADYCPERSDFVMVWKSIRTQSAFGNTTEEILSLSPSQVKKEKYCICMRAFREAGLISSIYGGHIVEVTEKVNLDQTSIIRKLKGIQGK